MNKSKIRVVGHIQNGGVGHNLICHRECKSCNSLLEFKSGDVEIYNDDNTHLEYIICPNCRKLVVVVCSKCSDEIKGVIKNGS